MSSGSEGQPPAAGQPTPAGPQSRKQKWAEAFDPKWIAGIVGSLVAAAILAFAALVLSHDEKGTGDRSESSATGLARGLLVASEAPQGWIKEAANLEQGLQRFDYCGVEPDVSAVKERVLVKYTQAATGTGRLPTGIVVHVVTQFRSADAARRVMDRLAQAGRSCHSYEKVESGGTIRTKIMPTKHDKRGDQSLAFASETTEPSALRGVDVIVRKGAVVSAVEYGAPAGAFDDSLWRQLNERAVARLDDVAG